jgi:hypothetical protein
MVWSGPGGKVAEQFVLCRRVQEPELYPPGNALAKSSNTKVAGKKWWSRRGRTLGLNAIQAKHTNLPLKLKIVLQSIGKAFRARQPK